MLRFQNASGEAIKSAIAALEVRLNQKQEQFKELEKQQQRQERLKRIEIGKAKAKAVGDEINDLVTQLEAKIDQLKLVCFECEPDY